MKLRTLPGWQLTPMQRWDLDSWQMAASFSPSTCSPITEALCMEGTAWEEGTAYCPWSCRAAWVNSSCIPSSTDMP